MEDKKYFDKNFKNYFLSSNFPIRENFVLALKFIYFL